MSGSDILNVLLVVGFVALVVHSILQSRKTNSKFTDLAAKLGIEDFKHTSSSLSGKLRGHALQVRFVSSSKSTPAHTITELGCSSCNVLLHLRRQTEEEEGAVRRGEAVDVRVGDEAFDAAWIIEGAPEARVLRVLSQPALRSALLAFRQLDASSITIEPEASPSAEEGAAKGRIRLRRNGTDVGPDAITSEWILLGAALADAVVWDAATPLEAEYDSTAGTYRTAPRIDVDTQDAAKIAELRALQVKRELRSLRFGAIGGAVFLIALRIMFSIGTKGAGMAGGSIMSLGFGAVLHAILLASYVSERRKAPGTPHDPVLFVAIAIPWIINGGILLLAAR